MSGNESVYVYDGFAAGHIRAGRCDALIADLGKVPEAIRGPDLESFIRRGLAAGTGGLHEETHRWVDRILLPLVLPDPYVLRVAAMTCIFAAFAASWDLLAGYAGQVNFGHALFFGAGAYSSALLSLRLGFSSWIAVGRVKWGLF